MIIALVPVMVAGLVRLNRAYATEDAELHADVAKLAETPTRRTHTVVVLVDGLDAADARAIQYARTLMPEQLRAVHFDIDPWRTSGLVHDWSELGLSRFPLEIIECPDRRVARAAVELAAEIVADGDTELTVLVPRREYDKAWHRLLHDRSSTAISKALTHMPRCSVTIIPYHLGTPRPPVMLNPPMRTAPNRNGRIGPTVSYVDGSDLPEDRVRVNSIVHRQTASVVGRVRAMRIQPWAGNPALECTVADETGSIVVVFFGRRSIGGMRLGTIMRVDGVVGEHHGMRAMLNPTYTILSTPKPPQDAGKH